MADRYWRGGTGTWNGTSTTNWSASSGGTGGASVPTAADNVFFDANSNTGTGAFTVTMATSPRVCRDLTISGLDGTMTLAGVSTIGLTVSGSLTFPATNFNRTYSGVTTFNATTTGKTITTNGVAFGNNVAFNGVGGEWTLNSAFSCGSSSLTVNNGIFNTNGFNVTAASLFSNSGTTRTINLTSSTVALNGSTPLSLSTTNFTLIAGTSQINLSSSIVQFDGLGLTFNNVSFTNTNKSFVTITGSNTFNTFTVITNTASPTTILFDAFSTTTVTNWNVNGVVGNLVTLNSSDSLNIFTLSKLGGIVSSDYLSINNSTATGGATWYAGANSVNVSGNSGWIFTAPPAASTGNFLQFF
jgi:hypothetical protein